MQATQRQVRREEIMAEIIELAAGETGGGGLGSEVVGRSSHASRELVALLRRQRAALARIR